MSFVLKMAWRDSRTARRRLVLFSLSIVLGVAALVAIGSFSANLKQGIDDQAKGLLGADLSVTSHAALTPAVGAFFQTLGARQAREISFASMVVFPSAEGQTRLVSVRAIEAGYPFYGEFVTAPVGEAAQLDQRDVALVEETLLSQFGVKVGDSLKLGEKTFKVAAALKKIPGESAAVATLSPRVYIGFDRLAGTGLLGPGSLVHYKTYLKLPPGRDAEKIVRDMQKQFGGLRLGFDTVEKRKRDLGKALQGVYAFLSLVGFVSLFLGAIGVASAISVYIRQKITTVAVLRCLGASARQGFAIYLVQGLALGLLGATLGVAAGVAVQLALPPLVKSLLPFDVAFFISWAAVARGWAAGLVICVLFTLLPLLEVRRVSPLVALRAAFAERKLSVDGWRVALYAVIAVAVAGFAAWQTQRWTWGLGFTAGLAAALGVLAALAYAVAWAARRFTPPGLPYVWRQGVANLHRPNNRTVLLLVSLGLGTFLLLTLAVARDTLLQQIRGTDGEGRPNLLFFDIQDDQIAPLTELLKTQRARLTAQAPVVTMRLQGINGRTVDELLKDKRAGIPAWTLRREYRSTYRRELTETEKLTAGTFYGEVSPAVAYVPVSVEEGLAKDMQLKLGDDIDFDVQGVLVKARVTSFRSVEWRRLAPNFFVVFPTGVLESAPKFYVVAAHVDGAADSARVQQAVVRAFPNVSAIDLALVLQTLDGIFSKVELVVRFMALFTLATGVVVLVGAVMTGRFQRIRETVLLRTLGASRRQLMQIQLVDYAVLGALAALTGGLQAWGAGAALAVFVFEAPVIVPAGLLAGAVVAVTAITLVTGWLSGRGLMNRPPLEVLREET